MGSVDFWGYLIFLLLSGLVVAPVILLIWSITDTIRCTRAEKRGRKWLDEKLKRSGDQLKGMDSQRLFWHHLHLHANTRVCEELDQTFDDLYNGVYKLVNAHLAIERSQRSEIFHDYVEEEDEHTMLLPAGNGILIPVYHYNTYEYYVFWFDFTTDSGEEFVCYTHGKDIVVELRGCFYTSDKNFATFQTK